MLNGTPSNVFVGNGFIRSAWVTFLLEYVEWKNVENGNPLPSNEPRMFTNVSERINPFPTKYLYNFQFTMKIRGRLWIHFLKTGFVPWTRA